MNKKNLSYVAFSFLLYFNQPVFANSVLNAPIEKRNLPKIMDVIPANNAIKGTTCIDFATDGNGNVKTIKLTRSSGEFDFDFDCANAILSNSPFKVQKSKESLCLGNGEMSRDDNSRIHTTKVFDEFRMKTGFTPDLYVLCCAIPMSVLEFYPASFSKEELVSLSNVRAIPKTFFKSNNAPTIEKAINNQRFRSFYTKWSDFIRSGKKLTSDEVKKFRDEMDSEYRDMFVSPVPSISEK